MIVSARRYVYVWVDGVYPQARLEDEKQCIPVIIGATSEGKTELIGFADGARESAHDWRELLPGLFDERNLISLTSEDYPANGSSLAESELAMLRAANARELIAATQRALEQVAAMAAAGRLSGRDKIAVRVSKVIGKYKVGQHFDLEVKDAAFAFSVNVDRGAEEAALDGLYVIRTSAVEAGMSAEAAVLNYKRLAEVERAFRTLKCVDLQVRRIRHLPESRVNAHIVGVLRLACRALEALANLEPDREHDRDGTAQDDPLEGLPLEQDRARH